MAKFYQGFESQPRAEFAAYCGCGKPAVHITKTAQAFITQFVYGCDDHPNGFVPPKK